MKTSIKLAALAILAATLSVGPVSGSAEAKGFKGHGGGHFSGHHFGGHRFGGFHYGHDSCWRFGKFICVGGGY